VRRDIIPGTRSWWRALLLVLLTLGASGKGLAADSGTTPPPTPAVEGMELPGAVRRGADWVAEGAQSAEPLSDPFAWRTPLVFGRQVLWDTAYLLTAPVRWDRHDWARFTLLAAATGAFLGIDDPVDSFVTDHPRSSTEADIEDGIQKLAELPGIAAVVGGGYLYGLLADEAPAANAALRTGEALLIAELLFVEPLKAITGRKRPNAGDGPYAWFQGGASLPSSHTATAFVLATGVSEYAGNNLWVAVPAYTLASGVAFARVRSDSHFTSDVFVAATLGVVVTKTVFGLEQQRAGRWGADQITLLPFASGEFRGLRMLFTF
jgi:membrane-associated phospholipid phosphatase